MLKIMTVVLLAILSLNSAGCGTLRDKFVRKKSPKSQPKQIFKRVEEIYPADVRYTNNWIYYEIWIYEAIESMGKNHKKTYNSAQRALSNLKEMRHLLNEPRATELGPYIEQLTSITKELSLSRISVPRQRRITDELRSQVRAVRKQFNSDSIIAGNWINADAD